MTRPFFSRKPGCFVFLTVVVLLLPGLNVTGQRLHLKTNLLAPLSLTPGPTLSVEHTRTDSRWSREIGLGPWWFFRRAGSDNLLNGGNISPHSAPAGLVFVALHRQRTDSKYRDGLHLGYTWLPLRYRQIYCEEVVRSLSGLCECVSYREQNLVSTGQRIHLSYRVGSVIKAASGEWILESFLRIGLAYTWHSRSRLYAYNATCSEQEQTNNNIIVLPSIQYNGFDIISHDYFSPQIQFGLNYVFH